MSHPPSPGTPPPRPSLTRAEKADALREIKFLLSQVRNDWEYLPPPSSAERSARRAARLQRRKPDAGLLKRENSVIVRTASLRSGGLGTWRTRVEGASSPPKALGGKGGRDDDGEEDSEEEEEREKRRRRERGEYVWEDAWGTDWETEDEQPARPRWEEGEMRRTALDPSSDEESEEESEEEDEEDSDDDDDDVAPPTAKSSFRRRSSNASLDPVPIPIPKAKERRAKRRHSFSHRLHGTWLPRLPDSPPSTPITPTSPSSLHPIISHRREARINLGFRTFARRRDQWTHADVEGWVPLGKSRFADNPMRKLVEDTAGTDGGAATRKEVFERCVVRGAELPVPIGLKTMLVVLREGWIREGEWPPKVTPTPPPIGSRRAASIIGTKGEEGMGLGRVRRYLGMR